jgi:5-methylcytosine-specific restriction protein B
MGLSNNKSIQTTDVAKNTILYGSPGIGKKYSTVIYAVAIIEKKKFSDVKEENYGAVLERFNKYKKR